MTNESNTKTYEFGYDNFGMLIYVYNSEACLHSEFETGGDSTVIMLHTYDPVGGLRPSRINRTTMGMFTTVTSYLYDA